VVPDQFALAYDAMVKDAYAHGDRRLLVFVATGEADGVAAARIVTRLLQSDGVLHTVVPVVGYDDLQAKAKEAMAGDTDDDKRAILLVHCGATEDVRALLDLRPEARAYVVDPHRPLHLNNVADDNDQVFLYWDDAVDGDGSADVPVDLAELYSEDEDESDGGSSSADEDGDDDRGDGRSEDVVDDEATIRRAHSGSREGGEDDAGQSQREERAASGRRSSSPDNVAVGAGAWVLGNGEPGYGDDDGADDNDRRVRRRVLSSRADRRRERRRAREERGIRRLEYYARGRRYGRSASETLYALSDSLKKDEPSLLWLAAVGLTDQLVHGHIDQARYAVAYEELLARVKSAENHDQATETGHAGGAVTKAFVHGRVSEEEALRLHLHRHWSLYEALVYSPFVAARLRTWSEAGRTTVETLLAVMGLPLREAKKTFGAMDPRVRRGLPQLVDEWVKVDWIRQSGLIDMKYDSFKLHYGYTDHLGAADVVSAVTALIEGGDDASRQFWAAWEALSPTSPSDVRRGLELSKNVQRAIVEQAGRAIQGRRVERYANFCCLNLSEGLPPRDRPLLRQPAALGRLASFVQDAFSTRPEGRPFLRMVVVGPEDRALGTCCVVGVASPLLRHALGGRGGEGDDAEPAPFGLGFYFQQAAAGLDPAATNDAFASSVVRVRPGDVSRFLDELHEALEGSA